MVAGTESNSVGVLASGGLDSSILIGHLLREGRRVQPFYIRTGLVWQAEELPALVRFLAAVAVNHLAESRGRESIAEKNYQDGAVTSAIDSRPPRVAVGAGAASHLAKLVVLDLPLADLYDGHWSLTGRNIPGADSPDEAVYLPGRNALLIVKAAVWCQLHGISELAMAPLGTSPFDDAGSAFFRDFQAAINHGGQRPVRLSRPFGEMNKRQVMALGRGLPLELTFSCISPTGGLHCGVCNKCAERQGAFREARIEDRTVYAN